MFSAGLKSALGLVLACWFAGLICEFSLASPQSVGEPSQSSSAGEQAEEDFEAWVEESISILGVPRDKNLFESSGLVAAAGKDSFWTINDSGNPAQAFCFGHDGTEVGKFQIRDAKNVDWEALASINKNGKRWVIVADVGDNQRIRSQCQLYAFVEPQLAADGGNDNVAPEAIAANTMSFVYRDAKAGSEDSFVSKDCEAASVDPVTGDLWLVEKVFLNRDRKIKPGIYKLALPDALFEVNKSQAVGKAAKRNVPGVAQRVGSFPERNVTGMAFSPDGKKLIVRNYLTAHLYIRDDDRSWEQTVQTQKPMMVGLPFQGQGEAICFLADSTSVIVSSEGQNQPIWKVDLTGYFEKFQKGKPPKAVTTSE